MRWGLLLTAAVLAIGVIAPPFASGAGGAPRIAEVDYVRENGGSRAQLEVFGKRIERIRFAAHWDESTYISTGEQDTDIDGHPWIPKDGGGRGPLMYAVRHAFDSTGVVRLKVTARNDAGVTKEKVRIVRSECETNSPTNPYTCVVEL
jgi:hypothetical protein